MHQRRWVHDTWSHEEVWEKFLVGISVISSLGTVFFTKDKPQCSKKVHIELISENGEMYPT